MSSSKSIIAVITALAVIAALTHSCKEEKHYRDYFDTSQLDVIATIGQSKSKLEDHHLDYDTTWVDANGMHHIAIDPLPDNVAAVILTVPPEAPDFWASHPKPWLAIEPSTSRSPATVMRMHPAPE